MQFNPLPGLLGLPPAGTVQIPVNIQRNFQQSLVPISPAANPVATPPGHLSVTYSLQGGVTETVTPPATAGQPATLSATFQLTGKLTEVLIVPGVTGQP